MYLRDQPEPQPEPTDDGDAPIPNLLEDYKTQHLQLQAQTRELERLRDQVRATAEREASAIVTAARRDVRKVLVDARRELLVLVAQLQAVGCESRAEADDRGMTEEAASFTAHTEPASPAPPDPFGDTRELISGARRDVREVLLEARSELVALSDEARELRAHVAKHHDSGRQSFLLERFPHESARPSGPLPTLIAPRPRIERLVAEHTSLSSSPRVWIPFSVAIVFAAIALLIYWSSGSDGDSPDVSSNLSRPSQPPLGATPQSAQPPPVKLVAAPTSASADSVLSLTIEVRRPAWIRTTVDGAPDRGRVFEAGERTTIVAKRDVVLRAGDAGAVFVSVNGERARPLGNDGQVITRRFASSDDKAPPTRVAPRAVPPTSAKVTHPGADAPPAPLRPAPAPASTSEPQDVRSTVPATPAPSERAQPASATPTRRFVKEPAPASASDEEREILRVTQKWFDAYFDGNRTAMAEVATEDFSIADQRTASHRIPAAASNVQRSMEQVRIDVAGDGAVLSAQLTERASVGGAARQYVSLVSKVFIRRDGRWWLMGVRLVDAPNLALVPR